MLQQHVFIFFGIWYLLGSREFKHRGRRYFSGFKKSIKHLQIYTSSLVPLHFTYNALASQKTALDLGDGNI